MSENYMPSEIALKLHLLKAPPQNGIQFFSGFMAALGDARSATGRDDLGRSEYPLKHGCWLGAIGYMALLDQIGSCFKPINRPKQNGNTITKALKYFTSLSDAEIDAIYALRCAFAHDYSLYNINNRPSLTHRFQVTAGGSLKLVDLPNIVWDGDYANKSPDNVTTINLESFGNMVESICSNIFTLANNNGLEVVLIDGTDELLQRYSYFTRIGP